MQFGINYDGPLVRDRVGEGGTGRVENRLKFDTPFPFTVPTAVGHKFDQLVLRLQFLICRRSRDRDRDRQTGGWTAVQWDTRQQCRDWQQLTLSI